MIGIGSLCQNSGPGDTLPTMYKLLAIVLCGMIGLSTRSWADPSLLRVDMPYMQARQLLLSQHWSPTNYAHESESNTDMKNDDDFLRSDFLKRGAPEVGACFGTGMGQCFAVWEKGKRILIVESRSEGFSPETGPTVYFFYEVSPARTKGKGAPLTRDDWDPRSANVVPNTYPKDHPW